MVVYGGRSTNEDQASHPASSTITHHGFTEDHIRQIYEEAGMEKDFAIQEMAVVFHFSKETETEVKRRLFLARGTKA